MSAHWTIDQSLLWFTAFTIFLSAAKQEIEIVIIEFIDVFEADWLISRDLKQVERSASTGAIKCMKEDRYFGDHYHFEDIKMVELAVSIINKSLPTNTRSFRMEDNDVLMISTRVKRRVEEIVETNPFIEERGDEEMKRPQRNVGRKDYVAMNGGF